VKLSITPVNMPGKYKNNITGKYILGKLIKKLNKENICTNKNCILILKDNVILSAYIIKIIPETCCVH
jgi:hypothetical protein